jgi:ubiquinone/menaquinone biosynthesis C-methylase UbiE
VGFYSRYLLPPLISCGCGAKPIAEQRSRIVPRAEGVVLELGMGSGHNLRFYDPDKVSRVYGLEPEAGMLARARSRVADAPVPVTVLPERAEEMSLAAGSVDTVVVTFALCTIPDVVTALGAARRAMRPGGRLLFCEHGCSPEPEVFRWQERLDPLWGRLFGGCHLTRDIPALIRQAGFAIADLDAGYMPKTPRIGGFLYRGSAAVG